MEVVEEHQRILMRQLMLEALEVEELILVDLLEDLVLLDRDLPEVLVAAAPRVQVLEEEELEELALMPLLDLLSQVVVQDYPYQYLV